MKKLITGIIVMVVLLFTIFPGIFVKAKETQAVSIGYGWSTEENERVAMRKAVSMVKEQLGGVVLSISFSFLLLVMIPRKFFRKQEGSLERG